MIELVQFPWSPFCIVQRRILEFSGASFKITNISSSDRSLVWKLSQEQYYGVPIVRDGRRVVFESGDDSQDIAKYLDEKLKLGLFPPQLEGLQSLLWRNIESHIEDSTFRLNDIHWKEFVPKSEHVAFVRHKERKFGRGCLDRWRREQKEWLAKLETDLIPYEQMLQHQPFLLGERPRFVDFELFGMLGNFLFTGHYRLPKAHKQIQRWYRRMTEVQFENPCA